MAKLILAGAMLLMAHSTAHAQDVTEEVWQVAEDAGVDAVDLQGAVNTTKLGALEYMYSVGELTRPIPPPSAALAARVACIEAKESGGANVWNKTGSGAGGVMQYMPGTFAAHAAQMGHPEYSLWNPEQARAVAAFDLARGLRTQWTVGGC